MSLSAQRRELRLRLLDPGPHVHLAVHRGRDREMLLRGRSPAPAPVQAAEAAVTARDEGTQPARVGQEQGLPVVPRGGLDLARVATGGDLTEEPGRARRAPASAPVRARPESAPRRAGRPASALPPARGRGANDRAPARWLPAPFHPAAAPRGPPEPRRS